MQSLKRTYGPLIILLLLLLQAGNLYAIDEHYAAAPLQGSQIRVDSTSTVTDTVYFNGTLKPLQTSWQVRNLITFKLDEFANVVLPSSFDVTIQFKVYYVRDAGGTPVNDSTGMVALQINYSSTGAYVNKAIHTFTGGHSATVKIFSVTVNSGTLSEFEDVLVLENEIFILREYQFSCFNNAIETVNHSTTPVSTKGELLVYWDKDRAADEYDLEWTFVDASALENYYQEGSGTEFDPVKIFTNNATRVSIADEQYYIPLLYESSGQIFYRVRAVQVKANGQRLESVWSSDYENGLGSYEFAGHEETLNWQATTSFAEDGKRKSVVQYFDGSLRGRQTVTKDNTTDTTIVAETFYDHQGTPVIQVLPTPSLSAMIQYTPDFNQPLNGTEYTKDLYDGLLADSCFCTEGAPAMDSLEGAARYYSPANHLAGQGFHKYIPDAKKYPFSETRYLPDNTGRISLQSGVGYDFQIGRADENGTTHETRYYYGGADQEELDALFGTEVGHASHYFKNMVRDANGQYSVSYVDMHGRTIATALAGKPSAKLDTLASYKTQTITKRLLDSNNNIIKGRTIESSKGLMVTKAGDHRFVYSLMPDSLSIEDCMDVPVCYDCTYDLEITITDDCNNATLPNGEPIVFTATNLSLDTTCNANTAFPGIDETVFLREGSYLVTKKLHISDTALNYYRDSVFMRRNTCKTLEEFIQEEKELLQALQCEPSCQTCMDSLGTWETFRPKVLLEWGIPVSDTAAYRTQAQLAYNEMLRECNKLCGNTGMHETMKELMLADMSAPYGQYANLDEEIRSPYSIFYKQNNLMPYQGVTTYVDENGEPEQAQLLDEESFGQRFKPGWAEALLPLHPEYHKLKKFEELAASHLWDERFEQTESFQAAVDSGYLNPGNFSPVPSGTIFQYKSAFRDPFFTDLVSSGVVSADYKTLMQDSLEQKAEKDVDGNEEPISMWALATLMAHCPTGDNSCYQSYTEDALAFSMDDSCSGELDIAWRYFREMYLQEKRELISQLLTDYHDEQSAIELSSVAAEGHFLHFTDPQDATNDIVADEEAAQDTVNTFIENTCRAYAEQWWNELKPCGFSDEDSAEIIDRLIAVCREGGDEDHILGSRVVKPSSTHTDRSFEQVIKEYAGENYNSNCNVYLITVPKAYDAQPVYADKPLWQNPDSCECATIDSWYEQYLQYREDDSSFAAYLYRTTGTRMYDGVLDTLRMACNGEINCSFLKEPLVLPPLLQCGGTSVCADCEQIDTLYQNFTEEFPNIIPRAEDTDSLQQEKNRLFEKYMNTHLGFSKQAWEYLVFMEECEITGPEEDNCNVALMFNGMTNKRRITISPGNDRLDLGTGAFTFEAIIKPKVSTHFNPILTNRTFNSGPLADGFLFQMLNSGKLLIQMEGCYNYIAAHTGGINAFDGKAHHVAVTRDGDSLGLYLDGIKLPYIIDCTHGTTETPSQRDITTSGIWYIGFDSTGSPPYATTAFNGWIDEVRVWNVARSPSEIANNMYSRLNPQAGLVGYYLMNSDDTCSQTVIDYSTDNPSERNNGTLGYSDSTEIIDPVWLSPAQISYDTTDPADVPNICACAPATENCDTLMQWMNDFHQYGNIPHLDASGADTTRWKVNFGGTFNYTVGVPLGEVFTNGVATLPDYYLDTLTPGPDHVDFDRLDTLCFDTAGFDFEVRLRLPDSLVDPNSYGDSWWIRLGGDSTTSGAILAAFGYQDGAGAAICTHQDDSQKLCADENVPAVSFNDWRVAKLQFRGTDFKLFLDDSLMGQRTLTAPFTKLLRYATIVSFSLYGEIDYIRIKDTSGNLLYNEEFTDATSLAQPDSSLKCKDCETRFTEYFNQRNGSSYTFTQIDSIYSASCNVNVHPCSDFSVNNLEQVKDEFVNLYYNHGRKYDANGCDTITWRVNYPSTYQGFPVSYNEVFGNGVMQFPDSLGINGLQNRIDYDFVRRDSACIDRHFSLEFRMRQDHFRSMWMEMWFNPPHQAAQKYYIVLDSPTVHWNYVAYYDYGIAENNREHFDITEFRQDFSYWRTIRFEIVDSVFNYYLDGQLLRSFNFPTTIAVDKFYGFGVSSRAIGSLSAEYDYFKAYDKNGNVFYFEDFNDCHTRSVFADYIRCPKQPCDVAFTEFFNNAMGTSHTYEQIKELYEAHDMPLHLCDSAIRELTLCGRTEPVFETTELQQHSPCDDTTLFSVSVGTLRYEAYRDSLLNSFTDRYLEKCLGARYYESFTVEQPTSEFHYTLYYYDQAGNLVKTIPPAGVDMSKFDWLADWSDSVKAARNDKELLTPAHGLPTNYRYNTLNQVVAQHSPDGGLSEFWYDRLGRLTISRNAKQKAAGTSDDNDRLYSYTLYDHLGRITEVGQVTNTSANGAMTDLVSRSASSLNNWLQTIAGSKEQITRTVYDLPFEGLVGSPNPKQVIVQRNLRNRVSYVSYSDVGADLPNYNNATFYTYDILGNVDSLLQDYGRSDVVSNVMNANSNRYKKIVYKFDLISGKVNMVMYQPGYNDRFYHRYSYDAENRLTLVETSLDSLVWERDARYEYYRHGPLARMTIGEQMVQGVDYAYTLQGWLKGMNSTSGAIAQDVGNDGQASGLNQYTARDALGLTLNYFGGEYAAINGTVDPFPDYHTALGQHFRPLYNGNISSTSLFNRKFLQADPNEPVRFYNYRYDQLNRLTGLDMFTGYHAGSNSWPSLNSNANMQERVAYDANGNITQYRRNAWPTTMDSLQYTYYPGTNRLRHIGDSVEWDVFGSKSWELILDIDSQANASNYIYDEIGNLIEDKEEQITEIKWSVYGKIREITRNATQQVNVSNAQYTYDAMGNRIGRMYNFNGMKQYVWYVRDAQGNVLSTYTAAGNDANLSSLFLSQSERYVYGSSRLGTYGFGQGVDNGPIDMQFYNTNQFWRRWRQYELTNHLGNVLAVISDRKFGVSSGGSLIDYYDPDIIAGNDYYPFGMLSRVATSSLGGQEYRFGFNGKEHDSEAKGWMNQYDYGFRVYDPRIGKFLSVDPLTTEYPWYTPYQFAGNKPIYALDLDGAEEMPYTSQFEYDGSWGIFDWVKAVPNAVGRAWNTGVVDTWNGGVATVRSIGRGTYFQDLGDGAKQAAVNVKNYAVDAFDYHTTTPIRQQLNDAGNYFTSPQALEDALYFGISGYVGNKIAAFRNKLLTPTTAETVLPVAGANAAIDVYKGKFAQPNHSNDFSKIGQDVLGVKSIDEAVTHLRSGAWTPSKLPIDYVVRDGQVYYLNTRSIATLTEAGIPKSKWTFVNQTGVKRFEENLTNNLNGSSGYTEVTNRKTGAKTKL